MSTASHVIYGQDGIEPEVVSHFYDALNLDYVIQGALMPDAHVGATVPIGSVLKTEGVIVPSWVGYDIGCSVSTVAINADVNAVQTNAREILQQLHSRVPSGFHTHATHPKSKIDPADLSKTGRRAFHERGGFSHLGTLGSGNHFLEIGVSQFGTLYCTIHSGSRGIGHQIASEYMKLEAENGGYLDLDSEIGQEYVNDMQWAVEFAKLSHEYMYESVYLALKPFVTEAYFIWSGRIHCCHNFAEINGNEVIHRKGATPANIGQSVLIPANMADGVIIGKGKGNANSLYSCSHGAGRKLSRKKAKNQVDINRFTQQMTHVTADRLSHHIDEAPDAYKSIADVMAGQYELVEQLDVIKPIINMKG